MLSTLLLLISTTFAGKLADDNGFRGIRFGSDQVLQNPPMKACIQIDPPFKSWACSTTIIDIPVYVEFWEMTGFFHTVNIETVGYNQCKELYQIFQASYGSPFIIENEENKSIYKWIDNNNRMNFIYNNNTKICSVNIFNSEVLQKIQEARLQKGLQDI